jgi:hypothetical protein
MISVREPPLLELGRGLRERLGEGPETALSDRMRELLDEMSASAGASCEGNGRRAGPRGSSA